MIIIPGDCREILPTIETASVQAIVTSVPYLRQRVYGPDTRELGRETTLAEYVENLAAVFDECRRVLHPSGLLWLNIGDKANGSGGAGGDWKTGDDGERPAHRRAGRFAHAANEGPGKMLDPDYHEGTYLDVPGAVVRELIRRDWRLRLPIVWDKGREAPESLRHVGRPRFAHEMLYMLAPGGRPKRVDQVKTRFFPSMLDETGSVWHFKPGGNGDKHLAPFPDELARRCILPSTLPGDIVLDPFSGAGTTPRVAEEHGRQGVGIELYAPALAIAEKEVS